MKAKIIKLNMQWYWRIYFSNGLLAAEGRYYTRRDNCCRGLKRFLEGLGVKRSIVGKILKKSKGS